jgi:7-keto-8-aminopelargonate synthetase-like enzyme
VWALQIVPLAKVLTLTGDIGFTLTIDDTFSVGTA